MARPKKSNFDQEFKRRLVMARKTAGFSQLEVANRLGMSLDAYKKYENRPKSLPPLEILADLCILLDQDPWFFIGFQHKTPPQPATLKRVK